MAKLIKYEFKKSLFSKLLILGITAALQLLYLIGLYGNNEDLTYIGMMGLAFTALASIAYIGIESILILYRDLTSKQSYMLFMTPNNSYKILGAKALENALAVLMGGAFFTALALLDFQLLLKEQIRIKDIMDLISELLELIDADVELSVQAAAAVIFMLLCAWILRIVTGYLAVVVTVTVLSGKRGSAFISFLLYAIINFITGFVDRKIPYGNRFPDAFLFEALVSMAWAALMYFISAWIMDRKLSV